MVSRHSVIFILTVALATLSCGLPSASIAPTPAPTQQAIVPTSTAATASLTIDQIKNAQYQLGTRDDHAVVKLADGKYQQGTDTTAADYASIVLADSVAFGDLNGDGVNEGAAIVFENYGGTGEFAMLTIYSNVNGLPVFLTSVLLGDRPMINSISIDGGEVFLDATIQGTNDPSCCPTLQTTRRYILDKNKLQMLNYTTNTLDGKKHEIAINIPANGSEATGSVQVTGTVSIAPFENNLSYFVYDEAGNELAKGPVPVSTSDPGAPGTFDSTIALANIPAGATVYLEIQDISAADGSWLAMDAVKLAVK